MKKNINFNNFKIIEPNILLHIPTGKVFNVSKVVKELIIRCQKNVSKVNKKFLKNKENTEIGKIINSLYKLEIEGKKISGNITKEELRLRGISLLVSQRCNFKCVYCYAGGGTYGYKYNLDMKFDIAKKGIEFLLKNRNRTLKILRINFFGGEPLLNFSLIKNIVKYCKNIERNLNIRFKFSLTTNGSIFNQEIINFLKNYDFFIEISLDGPPEIHNLYRKTNEGKNTYELVKNNIYLLCKEGLNNRISLRATFNLGKYDLSKIISHLRCFNVRRVYVDKIGPFPGINIKLTPINKTLFKNTIDKIFNKLKNKKHLEVTLKSLPDNWINLVKMIHFRYLKNQFCSAGKSYLAVSSTGNIYPCHRFVGQNEWRLGSVDGGKIDLSKLSAFYFLVNGNIVCNKCWAKYYCGGGCPYINWVRNNDPCKPDSENCVFYRYLLERLIQLYSLISDDLKKEWNKRRGPLIVK